ADATTLTARDPNGAVVTGYTGPAGLKEMTSFGEGRISPASVTLTNGVWNGNVTMYRADETSINRGNVNKYAYDLSNPAKNGSSDPFIVHPGTFSKVQIVVPGETPLPGSVSGVTGTPATQAVGTAFVASVYATDAYWNPLPSGDNVRVVSNTDPAETVSPSSGVMSNGFRTFTVTLNTVGTQTLTASDLTNGSISATTVAGIQVIPAGTNGFVVNPGPLYGLQVILPGETALGGTASGKSGTPTTQSAGNPFTMTVRAVDQFWNLVPGVNDRIGLASTDSFAWMPTDTTLVNGQV